MTSVAEVLNNGCDDEKISLLLRNRLSFLLPVTLLYHRYDFVVGVTIDHGHIVHVFVSTPSDSCWAQHRHHDDHSDNDNNFLYNMILIHIGNHS
jgi:hypothetical protein